MLCPRYPQFGYDKSGNPHTEESYSKETAEGWRKFWSEKFAARDAAILKVLEGK
jgi:antitoxin component YwqK of YwqJK toxin-antitoxin module